MRIAILLTTGIMAFVHLGDSAVDVKAVSGTVQEFTKCKGEKVVIEEATVVENTKIFAECNGPLRTPAITSRECLGLCVSEMKGIINKETREFNKSAYVASLKGIKFPTIPGIILEEKVIDSAAECAKGVKFPVDSNGSKCPESKKFDECVTMKKKQICE